MSKDTMISFRTTEAFSKSLKKIAKKNKITLSAFIDVVLQNYLQSQTARESLMQERRRFPRQQQLIPAIISGTGNQRKTLHASKITNLSLSGINLLVPRNDQSETLLKDEMGSFEVVFSLPRENKPITIQCQGTRFSQTAETFLVGATFNDTDFDSYQALRGYLI